MDIHNNLDGKGLKATNFADGTADTDLATVGQLGGVGLNPVIFVGGRTSYTVWDQTSTNGEITTTLTKTTLFTSQYATGCSYISDGTNDIVSIDEIGFFRVNVSGWLEVLISLSSSNYIGLQLKIYLLDSTSKSVIYTTSNQVFDLYKTNSNVTFPTNNLRMPFSVNRIYNNTTGNLRIGAYMDCWLTTENTISRTYRIYYPTITVTRVY